MDIDILLMLQNFRNGAGALLVAFFTKMSYIGEMNFVLTIIAIIYWCISKRFGNYLLIGWSGNRILNGLLKVTACIYRPWIRDTRIIPDTEAIMTATGYSFPSGHSMNAASLYGFGIITNDAPLVLRIVLSIIVALISFSRIYLGVHTLNDILVGTMAGLCIVWLINKLIKWTELYPEYDLKVMVVGIGIAVAVAIFATLKSYPRDYDADEKLLVDGLKMANDTYKAIGWCIGSLTGWILERRLVCFSTDVSMITRTTRLAIGLLGHYTVSLIFIPWINNWVSGAGGTVISCFIQMFYISFVFPWFVKHFERLFIQT